MINLKSQITNPKQISISQFPNDQNRFVYDFECWSLEIGVYLVFGACNLVLIRDSSIAQFFFSYGPDVNPANISSSTVGIEENPFADRK
jgi:hypothetical protein